MRCSSVAPPAPQPTMARSTSSLSSKRRMSSRSLCGVRVPSLGSNHADALRSLTVMGWRSLHPVRPRLPAAGVLDDRTDLDRLAVDPVLDLPWLPLVGAEVLVAARVRRAAEADLVPRPRMRVEGG